MITEEKIYRDNLYIILKNNNIEIQHGKNIYLIANKFCIFLNDLYYIKEKVSVVYNSLVNEEKMITVKDSLIEFDEFGIHIQQYLIKIFIKKQESYIYFEKPDQLLVYKNYIWKILNEIDNLIQIKLIWMKKDKELTNEVKTIKFKIEKIENKFTEFFKKTTTSTSTNKSLYKTMEKQKHLDNKSLCEKNNKIENPNLNKKTMEKQKQLDNKSFLKKNNKIEIPKKIYKKDNSSTNWFSSKYSIYDSFKNVNQNLQTQNIPTQNIPTQNIQTQSIQTQNIQKNSNKMETEEEFNHSYYNIIFTKNEIELLKNNKGYINDNIIEFHLKFLIEK